MRGHHSGTPQRSHSGGPRRAIPDQHAPQSGSRRPGAERRIARRAQRGKDEIQRREHPRPHRVVAARLMGRRLRGVEPTVRLSRVAVGVTRPEQTAEITAEGSEAVGEREGPSDRRRGGASRDGETGSQLAAIRASSSTRRWQSMQLRAKGSASSRFSEIGLAAALAGAERAVLDALERRDHVAQHPAVTAAQLEEELARVRGVRLIAQVLDGVVFRILAVERGPADLVEAVAAASRAGAS